MLFERFTETIFLKESNSLQDMVDALTKLSEEYPNNEDIKEELFIAKKGLAGEKEIAYQLKKSNVGMYVLHDINIEYEDLKAQIDYVIITKAYIYFLECKNLFGNITVNEKGDFIREYSYYNHKVRKGIYSPYRQVEAQRDVFKKIWNIKLSKNKFINALKRLMGEDQFKRWHRVLVVAANNETILNTNRAPKDMKYNIIKADALIRKLEQDIEKTNKDYFDSRKTMEDRANFFLKINIDKNKDYYEFYKDKYVKRNNLETSEEISDELKENIIINEENNIINDEEIKNKLINFRKFRSDFLNIPAYYIFTNEELDKIIELKPKTVEELSNILNEIKIKNHGKEIIEELNKIF